jgi:hypothetical protein
MPEAAQPTSAQVAQRLSDLLLQFPSAASSGVAWAVLSRAYEQRYGTAVHFQRYGHTTAFDASTSFLWDVSRTVSRSDPSNPVLGVDDEIALMPEPFSLASWPSLYCALCTIVERRPEGLPLSTLSALLRHQWHSGFDESKLSFFTDGGVQERIVSLQHMVLLLIDWHDQWVHWHRSETRSTKLEKLSSTNLELLPDSHCDCLLRLLQPGEVANPNRLVLVKKESRSKAWEATAKSELASKAKGFSGAKISGDSPGYTSAVRDCIPSGIVQRYKSRIECAQG